VVSTNSVLFNVARTASHSAGDKALAGGLAGSAAGSGSGLARRAVSRAAVARDTPVNAAASRVGTAAATSCR